MNIALHLKIDAAVRLLCTQLGHGIRNSGPAIDPLSRGPDQENKNTGGLGLFIASEIAKAHQGSIDARSDQTETAFDVRLPRPA